MKKYLLLFFSLVFLSGAFVSCGDDDEEIDNTKKTYKVRYEATCSDANTTLRILYSIKNASLETVTNDLVVVTGKSPFSKEVEMKYGEYCYISVQQDPEADEPITQDKTFKSSIYVDNVKVKDATSNVAAISDYLLTGQ